MIKRLHIYYAEDDLDDQDLFKDALKDISAESDILIQNNGEELLRELKNGSSFPDLIFLDLNMPGINGYDALREIKKSKDMQKIPVIVFSTSDDDKAIATARDLGANLYLPKPTSYGSIKKVLKHSLSIDWRIFKADENNFVYRVA